MEEQLIAQAIEGGIWILLFVFLLKYVLNDSRDREQKYQEVIIANQLIIKELSEQLNVVHDIKTNVNDIKKCLENINK